MAVKVGDLESELIEAVCERVRDRLSDREAAVVETFVRHYYHWVPPPDLEGRGKANLYGAAISHWKLARERTPGKAKVRVYDPDGEGDGWSSPHTVIDIVSDDMPFIVDSVTMALSRVAAGIDLVIHPVMLVRRDEKGRLLEVLEPGAEAPDAISESVFHAEVTREPDRDLPKRMKEEVEHTLGEVRAAVEDWQQMRNRVLELARELTDEALPLEPSRLEEVAAFLRWVAENHFTFLGYREYGLIEDEVA